MTARKKRNIVYSTLSISRLKPKFKPNAKTPSSAILYEHQGRTSPHLTLHLSLLRSAVATPQATAAQAGTTDAEVGDLDALVLVESGDEVALAALAVIVLVGEPGVGGSVDLDGLDVVRDGRVAGREKVEDLLADFVGAGWVS